MFVKKIGQNTSFFKATKHEIFESILWGFKCIFDTNSKSYRNPVIMGPGWVITSPYNLVEVFLFLVWCVQPSLMDMVSRIFILIMFNHMFQNTDTDELQTSEQGES